jgi:hypothetical protein
VSFDQVRAEAGSRRPSSERQDGERPTAPPPFDIEAFARRSTAHDADAEPFEPEPAESGTSPAAPPVPPPSSVRVAGPSSAPPPGVDPGALAARTSQMIDRLSLGEPDAALELATLVLADDPSNPLALVCREQCQAALEEVYLSKLGPLHRVPLPSTTANLTRLDIDHRAGFLLSLMDGSTPVEAVLDLCAMPRQVAMKILVELIEGGAVRFL